jgi:hypothetical protein
MTMMRRYGVDRMLVRVVACILVLSYVAPALSAANDASMLDRYLREKFPATTNPRASRCRSARRFSDAKRHQFRGGGPVWRPAEFHGGAMVAFGWSIWAGASFNHAQRS